MSEYWNAATEKLPREALADLQLRRLRRVLGHAHASSRFWRERLDRSGVVPDQVGSLDEYRRAVPLLKRSDITAAEESAPPYGTFAASDVARGVFHFQTSGSSGAPPMRTFDTGRDWAWITDRFATALYALGIREGDVAMPAFSYGPFMAFWAAHYGLQLMGCRVVATGGLSTEARIKLLLEQSVNVLLCTPTYALRLASVAAEMGADVKGRLKLVVTSGEARPPTTRSVIADRFGCWTGEVAGMTEAGIIMFECTGSGRGMHIMESDFLEEVVDPETGEPVGYGERGVRVLTTLNRESIVMLRYWTGDLVVKVPHSDCDCGRTWDLYRGGILGRADDMRKVSGVWLSPVMVEDIARKFPEIDEFQTVVGSNAGRDEVVVKLEFHPGVSEEARAACVERFRAAFKLELFLTPNVVVAGPMELPRFEVKAKRFTDNRPALEAADA